MASMLILRYMYVTDIQYVILKNELRGFGERNCKKFAIVNGVYQNVLCGQLLYNSVRCDKTNICQNLEVKEMINQDSSHLKVLFLFFHGIAGNQHLHQTRFQFFQKC